MNVNIVVRGAVLAAAAVGFVLTAPGAARAHEPTPESKLLGAWIAKNVDEPDLDPGVWVFRADGTCVSYWIDDHGKVHRTEKRYRYKNGVLSMDGPRPIIPTPDEVWDLAFQGDDHVLARPHNPKDMKAFHTNAVGDTWLDSLVLDRCEAPDALTDDWEGRFSRDEGDACSIWSFGAKGEFVASRRDAAGEGYNDPTKGTFEFRDGLLVRHFQMDGASATTHDELIFLDDHRFIYDAGDDAALFVRAEPARGCARPKAGPFTPRGRE